MATYFVRPTNGSDAGGAADGLSFANAFKTLQKAVNTAIAGDEVRYCAYGAEGTETPAASVAFDTNSGTLDSQIKFLGADDVDGSVLTGSNVAAISGSSLGASTDLIDATSGTADFIHFENIRFTAATRYGVNGDSVESKAWSFIRCRIDNNGSHGVFTNYPYNPWRFQDCEIDNNTGWGVHASTGDRGAIIVDGCRVHDNGSGGLSVSEGTAQTSICASLIYGNSGDGIYVSKSGNEKFAHAIKNNSIYNNSGDGVDLQSTTTQVILGVFSGNSLSGNGGVGLRLDSAVVGDWMRSMMMDYNHFHGNVTSHCNLVTDANINDGTVGTNNVTGDPLFTSVVAGSEDFMPKTTSPLIGAGLNGSNIGAVAHADGGGGGSVIQRRGVLMGDQSTKHA